MNEKVGEGGGILKNNQMHFRKLRSDCARPGRPNNDLTSDNIKAAERATTISGFVDSSRRVRARRARRNIDESYELDLR
jgi:hypothetical protein